MGATEGKWRLHALLFIVVMYILMYSIQGVFLIGQSEIVDPSELGVNNKDIEVGNTSDIDNVRDVSKESGEGFISFLGGIWEFSTFQALDNTPLWASAILSLFTVCLTISLGYLVYTWAYEIIKALPFT